MEFNTNPEISSARFRVVVKPLSGATYCPVCVNKTNGYVRIQIDTNDDITFLESSIADYNIVGILTLLQ